jgi:hypothetical protein
MTINLFSRFYSRLLTASSFAILASLSLSSSADWAIDSPPIQAGQPQDIVISFKQNPMSEPEAVCLNVTLARSLSGAANVTLFPTLDGVALGDEKIVSSRRFKCKTPWEGEISLQENLELFLNGNPNNMVICPLCWQERYGDQLPDYGVLNPPAVGALLLGAEKVIDF